MNSPNRPYARAFATSNLVAAAVVLAGVFLALPTRWAPVDVSACIVAGALGAAGVGLFVKAPWAPFAVRAASTLVLFAGLLLIAVLALTASYLWGIYGPIGRGGGLIMFLVAALVVPYLVILPSVQLLWIGPRERAEEQKTP
jgi:hypothetical protein